jgi:general L-amino acid transport system permease protein
MQGTAADAKAAASRRRDSSMLTDPRIRSAAVQVVVLFLIVWLGWTLFENARQNLSAQRIASGFGFFGETAGFGISQTLIPYSEAATYGRAFFVGLVNTLVVSALGIVFASVIGFTVGIARLSSNVLLARLAGAYVEVLRNLPLLFQILFWYLAVLGALPGPRESRPLFGGIFFTNRGVLLPRIHLDEGGGLLLALLAGVLALVLLLLIVSRYQRDRTGRGLPALGWAVGLLLCVPLAVAAAGALPLSVEWPELRGFNFVGGLRVNPELLGLLFALSTYTASFIAEIVRAGVLAVPRGQTEAALSLGLSRRVVLRRVVAPQAMRLIVPPLTSQYLNIIKNSSLAAAIGYPDFFYVFAGTTLNQTGQAIEIIAITMAVYLVISLVTAALMNWYNRAVALKGA